MTDAATRPLRRRDAPTHALVDLRLLHQQAGGLRPELQGGLECLEAALQAEAEAALRGRPTRQAQKLALRQMESTHQPTLRLRPA